MSEETTVINKTDKPNSFEFGKAGNRFKIYFDSVEELVKIRAKLRAEGFYEDIVE